LVFPSVSVNPEPIVTVLLTRLRLVMAVGIAWVAPDRQPPGVAGIANTKRRSLLISGVVFDKTVAGKFSWAAPAIISSFCWRLSGMTVTMLLVPVSLTSEVVVLEKVKGILPEG